MQDKFDYHEAMHEAFGDDPTTAGVEVAKAKLDQCEERLIAAKSQQDAAYNRYAATLESCAKVSTPPSSSDEGKSKERERDNRSMKGKLKEPDERKDHAGKTHLKHMHAFTACNVRLCLLCYGSC